MQRGLYRASPFLLVIALTAANVPGVIAQGTTTQAATAALTSGARAEFLNELKTQAE